MIGTTIGHYEIIERLGAGGMGEVYKARDTRLDRSVAIKVLPKHIAEREDSRARFEREARTVASLNHPHICTLHDIGDGYMVMELIEGNTLASRVEKGAIPLDQALTYATQIADALNRAHRAGVTHRDVKPGNIMLTRDGVKVLDFGLAKSTSVKAGPTEATLTNVLTTEGTVLGTPQYMAPEQFEGKEADERTDIWAFGAVLYEMVTGQKAFQGNTYSSLVGAILSADPSPMSVKPFTPAWLERMVRRCLQKEPEDRYHCMRDLVLDLRSPPAEAKPASAKASRLPWILAAVLLITTIIGWSLWLGSSPEAPLPVALTVEPPAGSNFSPIGPSGGSAISPDGRTLAFVATNEKGQTLLYVRPLHSLEPRALAGTEDSGRPFWSPDSKSLAFVAQGKLKRIDLSGGTPVTLCDAGGSARGGDWNEDGVILFATNNTPGIQRTSASGGAPALATKVNREAGEIYNYYPQFLPGGREFLYLVRHNDPNEMGIAFGSIDSKEGAAKAASVVAPTQYSARYDPASERLLFIREQGTLIARRLELSPPRLAGDPVIIAESVRCTSSNGYAEFSLSRNGILFYGQGPEFEKVRFGWRDRSGKLLETIGEPIQSRSFQLSPDGTRVAYHDGPGLLQSDVWVMELARGVSTRITFNKGSFPHWSPDGKFLYYNKTDGIYRKAADGSGEEVSLAKTASPNFSGTVSPDGKALLFGNNDIMKLPLSDGTVRGEAEPYLKTSHREGSAAFSPDGRWVVYTSNESGRNEIYIQGYPDKRGKWLVSATGGSSPVWRQDGRELYWIGPDGTLMSASIELQAYAVRFGRPQPLFRLSVFEFTNVFEPSRDGQRFLVYEPVSSAQELYPMVVVQDWAARMRG